MNKVKIKNNIASIDVVADYFLLRTMEGLVDCMTTVKIQKLLYYAQGLSYKRNKRPLFAETFQAWARGPVCKSVYDRFKTRSLYGVIDLSKMASEPARELSEEDLSLLEDVWSLYGKKSGDELAYMAHQESPWKNAYGDRPMGSRCTKKITNESIKEYFA